MQCQDVKNIVKCCSFFFSFFLNLKTSYHSASKICPSHPCHVGKTRFVWHQDIYIFISRVVNESSQARQAGQGLDAAGD